MATSELSFGGTEIFTEETLGVGSYGKVCKAKCGQLPCAAKLLHDSMFDVSSFVERFKQECEFLRMIKHPNIVQFLGTSSDVKSKRLVLLMELMDESLTRFLERSTGPLPYHTQLNICHDVALALAYLHSNDIIHRDLSSNNVLLIGEGSRAKVTDFGMSKLIGMNPRMTPLTMCPGTQVYMPPEALITPPRYSNKLDCFSHGVLTIQIVTRQFPSPGSAHVEDPDEGLLRQVPERERRKKDLDLVDPNHPLLPLALSCIKIKDKDRPSAGDLCGKLATLKRESAFTRSTEQSRRQSNVSVTNLQKELEKLRANHESDLKKRETDFKRQMEAKQSELKAAKSTAEDYANTISNCQAALQAKTWECDNLLRKNRELCQELEYYRTKVPPVPSMLKSKSLSLQPSTKSTPTGPLKLAWRQGASPPETMVSTWGTAVGHDNTAYFSKNYHIYAYATQEDRWTRIKPCGQGNFAMAVVNDKLTTIGGQLGSNTTNTLLCLSRTQSVTKWEQLLPPMPSARFRPAAVTTPTHLIVAGGIQRETLATVEVLQLGSLQWSTATNLPRTIESPNLTVCGDTLYFCKSNTMYVCSVEELLKSCKPASANNTDHVSIGKWTKLPDVPSRDGASLTTLRGQVLAVGGSDATGNPTGTIHTYGKRSNSWSVIGEMPTPQYSTLVAVLASNELVVVGGEKRKLSDGHVSWCSITEVAYTLQYMHTYSY